jgi:hypothetical protein
VSEAKGQTMQRQTTGQSEISISDKANFKIRKTARDKGDI